MNSKNHFLLLIFLATILITISCHKENVTSKSKVELLTSTRWKFGRLLYEQPPGSAPLDFSASILHHCELDDIFQFKEDGSFLVNDNTEICNPANNGLLTIYNGGSWSLSKGDSLVLVAGLYMKTFLLSSITTTDLELKQTSVDYFQNLYTYRFQFKATP
jgi:hypothetical protein